MRVELQFMSVGFALEASRREFVYEANFSLPTSYSDFWRILEDTHSGEAPPYSVPFRSSSCIVVEVSEFFTMRYSF